MKILFLKILTGVICLFQLQPASANGYTVHVSIEGLKGSQVCLLKDYTTNIDINSISLQDGQGTFKGSLGNEPQLLFMVIPATGKTYWCHFFIGNEEVWLNATLSDFPYKVKLRGSPTQAIFQQLSEQLADERFRRDSLLERAKSILAKTDKASQDEIRLLAGMMAKIDSVEIIVKKTFISLQIDSYPAILELWLLRSKYAQDELVKLYEQIPISLQRSFYGQRLQAFLSLQRKAVVGKTVPRFTASDKDGKVYSFPAGNGKYQLLEFTKNNCLPCVQALEEMKSIQAENNPLLELVSFSTDEQQAWLKNLLRYPAIGLCLNDGKGASGPVVMQYGVEAYPHFFLVSPDGNLLAAWTGYAEGDIKKMLGKYPVK